MVVVKDRSYLVTCRVELGDFFGVPVADAFVELREPGTAIGNKFSTIAKKCRAENDYSKMIEVISEHLPSLIVDHDLYASENVKCSEAQVADIIKDKEDIFTRVVLEYTDKVLFTRGKESAGK